MWKRIGAYIITFSVGFFLLDKFLVSIKNTPEFEFEFGGSKVEMRRKGGTEGWIDLLPSPSLAGGYEKLSSPSHFPFFEIWTFCRPGIIT